MSVEAFRFFTENNTELVFQLSHNGYLARKRVSHMKYRIKYLVINYLKLNSFRGVFKLVNFFLGPI